MPVRDQSASRAKPATSKLWWKRLPIPQVPTRTREDRVGSPCREGSRLAVSMTALPLRPEQLRLPSTPGQATSRAIANLLDARPAPFLDPGRACFARPRMPLHRTVRPRRALALAPKNAEQCHFDPLRCQRGEINTLPHGYHLERRQICVPGAWISRTKDAARVAGATAVRIF